MTRNFKHAIRNKNELLLMNCPVNITRDQMEGALEKGDYDAVYFDGQHRPISDDKIVAFCAHAEALGMPAQMRLPHTRESYLVGRYCDFGLSSIMVPEVMTEETVVEATEYFYYGTQGRRSWGGPARAGLSAFGDPPDRLAYAKWWNDYAVLVLQFESVEAVANARRLADRPGIDYVAFGPNDLTFSLERHSGFPLATYQDCFLNVGDQLDEVGIKRCLAIVTKPEERDTWRALGISIFWEAARYEGVG
jgi:2-keto-3-deoxy-L-rhamnonate aldolase RhmA